MILKNVPVVAFSQPLKQEDRRNLFSHIWHRMLQNRIVYDQRFHNMALGMEFLVLSLPLKAHTVFLRNLGSFVAHI